MILSDVWKRLDVSLIFFGIFMLFALRCLEKIEGSDYRNGNQTYSATSTAKLVNESLLETAFV